MKKSLYHRDLGMPGFVAPAMAGFAVLLQYGGHVMHRMAERGICPSRVPTVWQPGTGEVFEVETDDRRKVVTKFAARVSYDDRRDLVIVIANTGKVITVWTNDKNDQHATLDISKYSKVKA